MKTVLLIAFVVASFQTLAENPHQPGGPDCPHKASLAPSPYVGQEQRPVKALSDEEQEPLLTGHGMGLARAAELNRFSGPKHVIELAAEIGLSEEQTRATRQIFDETHEVAVKRPSMRVSRTTTSMRPV